MGGMVSGDLLSEARRRAGLTQDQLAERVGVPRQQISRWERGSVKPSLERLGEVIRACGLDLAFSIVRGDVDGHDRALIERRLDMTPAERVARSRAEAASLARLRRLDPDDTAP